MRIGLIDLILVYADIPFCEISVVISVHVVARMSLDEHVFCGFRAMDMKNLEQYPV